MPILVVESSKEEKPYFTLPQDITTVALKVKRSLTLTINYRAYDGIYTEI